MTATKPHYCDKCGLGLATEQTTETCPRCRPQTEHEADLHGDRLTRDERKRLRTADLRRLSYAELNALRDKTAKTIEHLHATHEQQLANGMPVTLETLGKNCAPHWLTVQCIDDIFADNAR